MTITRKVLASLALEALDSEYGLSDKVIAGLDELSDSFDTRIAEAKRNLLDAGNKAVDSAIDYVVASGKRLLLEAGRKQLEEFSPYRLR